MSIWCFQLRVYVGQTCPPRFLAGCPTYMVTDILGKLKWNTAMKANAILNRSGPFWQDESYDHVVRDNAELERTIEYVLNNPVAAGLVENWQDWPWSFLKAGLTE